MSPEVIEARLAYKRPTPEQVKEMEAINAKIVDLGRAIGELPEGMMKSRAVTDLVLLRMVINAAVIGDGIPAATLARPEKPGPDYAWDDFAKRWVQDGAKRGPAIAHSP
jgi:hypothetical protein